MVDWAAHYDNIYRRDDHAVDAVLTIADSGATVALRVIPKLSGVEVGDQSRHALPVITIKPACAVRVYELTANGVTLEQTQGARIAFAGTTWRVENRMMKPGPLSQEIGEVYLILIEDRRDR